MIFPNYLLIELLKYTGATTEPRFNIKLGWATTYEWGEASTSLVELIIRNKTYCYLIKGAKQYA